MKTVEELYQQMTGDFAGRTGVTLTDGCDLAARMYALAAQIYALQVQGDWVRRQCFPQTAVGENLDHHAAMRGLERKVATKAEGVVRFYAGEASDLVRTIPYGTVVMTGNLVQFYTTHTGILLAGEMWVDVKVRALESGAAGNAAAGTVTHMSVAPAGIASCTNPEAFTGGVDMEDDESLRARVLESFRALPNGANAAYYRQIALSDPEIAQATVVPRPRGIGSVDVYIASHAGVPENSLLNKINSKLQEQREIAVDLRVRTPDVRNVSLSVQVKTAPGQDQETVCARVERALRSYFNGELLGQNVLLAKLGSIIYECEGVENYRILSPAADVTVSQTRLPVLSELKVEGMV